MRSLEDYLKETKFHGRKEVSTKVKAEVIRMMVKSTLTFEREIWATTKIAAK